MNNIEIAKYAIRKAAKELKKVMIDKIQINSHSGKDIKLEADKISETILIEAISKNSNIPILSEEMISCFNYKSKEEVWIIDPLDGSLNFSRQIPFYCISIGLWKNNKPELGVIYDLVKDDIYYGIVNNGAYKNGDKICSSEITSKDSSVICTGFPVYTSFDSKSLLRFISVIQEYKKVRLLGSAAFSLTLVASGSVEAYSEKDIAIWDVAGGLALLQAAGGKYELTDGRSENLVNIFATNGKLK